MNSDPHCKKLGVLLYRVALVAAWCASCAHEPPVAAPTTLAPTTTAAPPLAPTGPRAVADEIVHALHARDLPRVAALAHPRGVFLSSLPTPAPDAPRLAPEELARAMQDPTVREWGFIIGPGTPVRGTFAELFDRWLDDRDYASAPEVLIDGEGSEGQSACVLADLRFEGARVVEYHFPDSGMGKLDRRSLRVVLVPYEGRLRLVALLHQEWSP